MNVGSVMWGKISLGNWNFERNSIVFGKSKPKTGISQMDWMYLAKEYQ